MDTRNVYGRAGERGGFLLLSGPKRGRPDRRLLFVLASHGRAAYQQPGGPASGSPDRRGDGAAAVCPRRGCPARGDPGYTRGAPIERAGTYLVRAVWLFRGRHPACLLYETGGGCDHPLARGSGHDTLRLIL